MASAKSESTCSAANAIVVSGAVLFAVCASRRLWHSDLWAHLSYGRWMVEHGRLPDLEPFMPLASDVPIVATSWLSQLLGYSVHALCGHHGLQVLYGLAIALSFAVVATGVWHRTRSVTWSLVGGLVFLAVAREHLMIIRPQLAGLFCFCVVACVLQRRRVQTWRCSLCLGGVFGLWANLHPSFPAGLILIALCLGGRAIDLTYRTGRPQRVRHDRMIRHLAVLLFVAAAAVLVNPFGVGLYREVFSVTGNPNLRTLLDWLPLTLEMRQGRIALAAVVIAAVLMWRSPRRVTATELLMMVVAGLGALLSSRMIIWWAVVLGLVVGVHGNALVRVPRLAVPSLARGRLAVVVVVLAALAASPVTKCVIPAWRDPLADAVSAGTPVETGPVAIDQAAGGMIFSPNVLGDYLVWAGRDAANVMCTSHVHLIPRSVWVDYLTISRGHPECLSRLDTYDIRVVLLGPRRKSLRNRLEASDVWEPVHSARGQTVFVRRE